MLPALPQDTVLGRPGANVTLLCREREPPNGTVLWSGRRRALGGGNALLLGGLRPEDAGRYSCHLGGHTLRTVRLLVEGGCVAVWVRVLRPPPPPQLSLSPELGQPRVEDWGRSARSWDTAGAGGAHRCRGN